MVRFPFLRSGGTSIGDRTRFVPTMIFQSMLFTFIFFVFCLFFHCFRFFGNSSIALYFHGKLKSIPTWFEQQDIQLILPLPFFHLGCKSLAETKHLSSHFFRKKVQEFAATMGKKEHNWMLHVRWLQQLFSWIYHGFLDWNSNWQDDH